jgi:hypothetical protein
MRIRFQLLIAAMIAATTAPLAAHHSFSAEYNIADTVVLKGTLSTFQWTNPHSFLTIAVKDNSGVTKLWRIEGGPVWYLIDSGWSPEMLQEMIKSREVIIVTGYRARKPPDASFSGGAWASEIELADGSKLLFHD